MQAKQGRRCLSGGGTGCNAVLCLPECTMAFQLSFGVSHLTKTGRPQSYDAQGDAVVSRVLAAVQAMGEADTTFCIVDATHRAAVQLPTREASSSVCAGPGMDGKSAFVALECLAACAWRDAARAEAISQVRGICRPSNDTSQKHTSSAAFLFPYFSPWLSPSCSRCHAQDWRFLRVVDQLRSEEMLSGSSPVALAMLLWSESRYLHLCSV